MKVSQQLMSRLGFATVCVLCLAIGACTPSPRSSNPGSTTNLGSEPANATQAHNNIPGDTKEQFTAIIGTQQDGWLPKVLAFTLSG